MDDDTNTLFKRVAGKLGWIGPGALDSAEEVLVKRVGKGMHPRTGGYNAGPASASALKLSDSEDSGKENWQRNGVCRLNSAQHDSSDNNSDQFVVEKTAPKLASQRHHSQQQINSPPVLLVSSGSDSSFEEFLSRVKTPRSKPVATARNRSDDSLKHFIVDSFSSDDDFATESRKKSAPKTVGKPKTPRSLQVPRPITRRPPSQWASPVFLNDSDSDQNEGVVVRSTWKSRHTPRGPCSAGREGGVRAHAHSAPTASPDSSPRNPSSFSLLPPSSSVTPMHRAPPPPDDSSSSDGEFLSLLERIKQNHSVGKNRAQGALSVPVPKQKPCLSVPSERSLGGTGPQKVEKGLLVDRTPVQPASRRPHISRTEPRPATESRVGACRTPGCFLQSLSAPGSQYCRSFKQNREDLTSRLYKLYNSSVFDSKLPADMSVAWNKKMRKTAGYCITGQERGGGKRYARIELSEKVCDSADRLRDTLIHEMCHAATWLINGVRDGHGSFWKLYARKATLAHPELPMVTRCHSYDINYKYQYQCSRCKNTIGRHSKSLDTQRFVCALCTGQLVLLTPAKPRGATPFANFVKENYGTVRAELEGQSHANVMRKLSADFASMTRLSQS